MMITFVIAPSYRSTATLAIQPLTLDQPFGYSTSAELNARNVGELVKSPAVLNKAAKALKKGELSSDLEYRVLENSGLIQIIAVTKSPRMAADEANAIAGAFLVAYGQTLSANADRVQVSLQKQLASLREQIAAAQTELAAARAVPGGAAKVGELQDALDSLQTGYQNVLRQTQLLPAAQTMVSTQVIIADRAIPEPEQVSPKPLLNLLLAVAGGLLLGIAYARATEPRPGGHETGG
jgi:capsular polysaccharide biosynthesis protein